MGIEKMEKELDTLRKALKKAKNKGGVFRTVIFVKRSNRTMRRLAWDLDTIIGVASPYSRSGTVINILVGLDLITIGLLPECNGTIPPVVPPVLIPGMIPLEDSI